MDLRFGFAVKALTDQERPREDRRVDGLRARIVQRDVDHERDRPIVRGAVRHVETFGDEEPIVERELGDLRVRQERELALDPMR